MYVSYRVSHRVRMQKTSRCLPTCLHVRFHKIFRILVILMLQFWYLKVVIGEAFFLCMFRNKKMLHLTNYFSRHSALVSQVEGLGTEKNLKRNLSVAIAHGRGRHFLRTLLVSLEEKLVGDAHGPLLGYRKWFQYCARTANLLVSALPISDVPYLIFYVCVYICNLFVILISLSRIYIYH